MYNRNQNVISHILQTPVEPKSRNVLWDDGTNIKIWRKSGWTSIMGGGTSVEGGEVVSIGGYELSLNSILNNQVLAFSTNKWVNKHLSLNDLSDATVKDGILNIDYSINIKKDLIVEGDVSSGGAGQDTPIGGASYLNDLLDVSIENATKDDLLKYDGSKWIPISQNSIKPDLSNYLDKPTADNTYAIKTVVDPINTWYTSINPYFIYDSQLQALVCKANLIVEGDTSSGGTGQDNPGGGTGVSYLENLKDVKLSSTLSAEELLKYDGDKWINITQNELKAGKLGEMGSHKNAYIPSLHNGVSWYATDNDGFSNYKSTYGTSLWVSHIKADQKIWCNRLDFATSGGGYKIYHWAATDIDSSGSLNYIGELAYITSTVSAAQKIVNSSNSNVLTTEGTTAIFASHIRVTSNARINANVYIAGTDGLILNTDKAGIYITGTSINWHDSSNIWTRSIIGLTEDDVSLYVTLRPKFDKLCSLGSSDYRWSNVYSTNGNFNKTVSISSTGGMYVNAMNMDNSALKLTTQLSTNAYAPILSVKTSDAHICTLGGIGNEVGFYGFYANRTENGLDWHHYINVSNGCLYHSGESQFKGTVTLSNSLVVGTVKSPTTDGLNLISGKDGSKLFLTANCFRPWVECNKTIDLGNDVAYWRNLYAVNGIFNGDVSSGSDIRYKEVIENVTIDLDIIANAPLFTFKWNDGEDNTIHLGSSAQYWEKHRRELVTGDDFKHLNYASLGVAIGKSLAIEVKELKERIKVLEKELNKYKYGNLC